MSNFLHNNDDDDDEDNTKALAIPPVFSENSRAKKCWLSIFSPILTMFSKDFFLWVIKSWVLNNPVSNANILVEDNFENIVQNTYLYTDTCVYMRSQTLYNFIPISKNTKEEVFEKHCRKRRKLRYQHHLLY